MTPKDYLLSGLFLVTITFGTVQTIRLSNAQLYHAKYSAAIKDKMIAEAVKLNKSRNATEAALAEVGNKYFEGVNDANKLHDVTIARLNADNIQLQEHWREALRRARAAETKPTSEPADAAAEAVSADLAGFVRRAAEADATIVSLQNIVNHYLCQVNKEPYPGLKCN